VTSDRKVKFRKEYSVTLCRACKGHLCCKTFYRQSPSNLYRYLDIGAPASLRTNIDVCLALITDPGRGKSGHLVVDLYGRLDDIHGQGRTGAFPQTHL
jgi:hypothetical protein